LSRALHFYTFDRQDWNFSISEDYIRQIKVKIMPVAQTCQRARLKKSSQIPENNNVCKNIRGKQ
jgi:hypothetical protein